MTEELSNGNQAPQDEALRAEIKRRALEQLGWLAEAADVVNPPEAEVTEAPETDEAGMELIKEKVTKVFEKPPEIRDNAPMPDWTDGQAAQVRKIASRFGYGPKEDVLSGLQGGTRIGEGGKVWKMLAQAEAMKRDGNPDTYVFAGSPFVELGDDELEFMEEKYGVKLPKGTTQHDFACWLARREADGERLEEPLVLDFGYEVGEGNPLVREPTGQLMEFGKTAAGQRVRVLRVDQENYYDEEAGKTKFRYRPKTDRVMGLVSEIMTAEGKPDDPVAFVTSNTYASRQVSIIVAGLEYGRQFGITMYGRQTLLDLKPPSIPDETPLNHLPGDLRVMHDRLQRLVSDLSATS